MSVNVLVVDDSKVMRSMVLRTLRMTGIAVGEAHEASNGQEALDVLASAWIDLALIDINMPVMNGEELIERVRADPAMRDLAIIVVSTETSEARIERIRQHRVAFVHKPFTAEVLRQTILGVTGAPHEQSTPFPAHSGGPLDF